MEILLNTCIYEFSVDVLNKQSVSLYKQFINTCLRSYKKSFLKSPLAFSFKI